MSVVSTALALLAKESGLKLGYSGPAFHELQRLLRNDQDALNDALSRRELAPGVLQRDHIARWRTDAIDRATKQ